MSTIEDAHYLYFISYTHKRGKPPRYETRKHASVQTVYPESADSIIKNFCRKTGIPQDQFALDSMSLIASPKMVPDQDTGSSYSYFISFSYFASGTWGTYENKFRGHDEIECSSPITTNDQINQFIDSYVSEHDLPKESFVINSMSLTSSPSIT